MADSYSTVRCLQSREQQFPLPPERQTRLEVSTPVYLAMTDSSTSQGVSAPCDRCRELRTKCSGGTRCVRCTKDDAICSYSDRKRESNKSTCVDHRVSLPSFTFTCDSFEMASALQTSSRLLSLSYPYFLLIDQSHDYPQSRPFTRRG